MSELKDYKTPPSHCPACGHLLDAAMSDPNNPQHRSPQPGDISICIKCAEILSFGTDLTVHAMTLDEMLAVPPAVKRQIDRAVNLIKKERPLG